MLRQEISSARGAAYTQRFWTFDERQAKLAKAHGLKIS